MLARDRNAVEGLPLQLMIIAIVLAITIPIMFGALKSYDRSKLAQELDSEIDDFSFNAQMVYSAGPGNSQTFNFQAGGASLTRLDYVKFGDCPGGNYSSIIRYKLEGQPEALRLIQSPNVPMMSMENITLEIMPGQYRIIIECKTSPLDLNNDGHMPDNYIQLSLSETRNY